MRQVTAVVPVQAGAAAHQHSTPVALKAGGEAMSRVAGAEPDAGGRLAGPGLIMFAQLHRERADLRSGSRADRHKPDGALWEVLVPQFGDRHHLLPDT
jgi:hypothetical protein